MNLKDKFSGKMKQAGDKTKQNAKQMKLLSNRMESFKRTAVVSLTSVAKTAGVVGTALLGIGAAAETLQNGVQFLKDYQSSLNNLQASTGATSDEMNAMKTQIMDLYKQNMGESWADLAQAMSLAKQVTGQTGNELKNTTALAVTYRDVFGEDISQSIKASDTMMKNFGITSTQAYNLLAAGAQKGLNKSDELIDSANEYSPYFNALGFSANQMFDTFSAGLESGAFNLDKVGDAVKEFNIRAKDGSKGTAEAFKSLGFNAAKMSQTFAKGGPQAQASFKKIVKAISDIRDPVKKNEVGVQLFGTQFEDLEKDVIASMGSARSQFDMTKETMQGINQVKYDSATQAFKGIGRMLETSVLVPIGDKLLPKLSEFGQWFKDHTPQIEEAISKAFTAGGQVLDGFKQSIEWVRENANILIPVIGGLTAAIAAQKVIGVVTGLYKGWTAATKGMTLAQIALNLVTKASPFGWIAMAIGLVVAGGIALWKNWDTVKAKASQLWEWLSGIWTNIKTSTSNAFSKMGDSIRNSFNAVVGFVKKPINSVIGMINGLIDRVNSIKVDIPDWVPGMGGETFGINIPKIPEFALGTSYFSGGPARINERGGEIVNLPGGSQVIPADKSEKMIANSRQGITVQFIIQGNMYGEEEEVNRIMNKAIPRLQAALSNI